MHVVRRGAFLLSGILVLPFVLVSCSSGAATCAANTNVKVTGGTISKTPGPIGPAQGVTVSAVSPATTDSSGLHLPITGGNVNNSSLIGTINTNGGIKYAGPGGRSISFTNFSINTQNGLVSASANGQSVQFLQVMLSTASKSTSSNQVNVSGLASTLASAGALILNRDLAVTTFNPGVQFGTFTGGIKYSC